MNEINIESINSPADLRKLDISQLTSLAGQLRAALLHKLSAHGGHVGPNLGMVEATIALHYVFNTPVDKIVFDVSHQTYVHKMLTGRLKAFTDPGHYNDVTGFTNPAENPDFDLFSIGHTSTSVSLASGIAKARDLRGGKENVIAVIGDASTGGGMAFEGLNYAATLGTNFIVIVNDNQMSIAENHGGLFADLRLLRNTNGEGEPNFFRSLGFSYRYVRYGNDLRSLIEAFRAVKDIDHPVVVHINTMKGLGLPVAEADKEKFHFCGPFDLKSGSPLSQHPAGMTPPSYTEIFAESMLAMMRDDERVVVLNAGTPGAIGFTPDKRRLAAGRFVDVGIAEQDCVGMAAGMAKAGMRPVVGVVATFLQRAYDQMSHDVAINRLPVVLNVFYGGLYGMNDETHLGFFDIAMISSIPGINYLAPTCREEYDAMLRWAALKATTPVAVRVPDGGVVSDPACRLLDDYSEPEWDVVEKGDSGIAIIGAGNFFTLARDAAALARADGTEVTLINPRSFTHIDNGTLETLRDYKLVITLEDGIIDGGFGQKVAAALGNTGVRVECFGLRKEFLDEYDPAEVAKEQRLTPDSIFITLKRALTE